MALHVLSLPRSTSAFLSVSSWRTVVGAAVGPQWSLASPPRSRQAPSEGSLWSMLSSSSLISSSSLSSRWVSSMRTGPSVYRWRQQPVIAAAESHWDPAVVLHFDLLGAAASCCSFPPCQSRLHPPSRSPSQPSASPPWSGTSARGLENQMRFITSP